MPDDTVETAVGGRALTGRTLALAGLAGVAITQPVLDLFGRNPEFFVAGGYSTSQIVGFAAVVALVPSAVAAILLALAQRLHPVLGTVAYSAGLGALTALFTFSSLRLLGSDSWLLFAVGGVAAAGAVVIADARIAAVRLFLRYLAVSNLLFVASMLLFSPSARLLTDPAYEPGRVVVPQLPGPVVVVVLDELPVTTLMGSDGQIDASRYPGFAALADRVTWFRNASSLSEMTPRAVPELLTGQLGEDGDLPTAIDHGRNLLSLLGREVPVHRYEVATDLCPRAICDPLPRQPLSRSLKDAGIVYAHRVLPEALRDSLPAIDHSWGQFGAVAAGVPQQAKVEQGYDVLNSRDRGERHPGSQLGILRDEISAISGEPAVHLVHVLAPHYPWLLTPWGSENVDLPVLVDDEDDPAYEWSALQRYQAHAMQVGALDAVVQDLLEHLDVNGIWDDTTLVVAADHGTSLLPPDFGRDVTERNIEEVFRVPLFVKAPGQASAEVRDDVALTLDVLPTLVDILDIETSWTFDGHSLLDGSRARVAPVVDRSVREAEQLADAHARDFPKRGWLGLAATGDHAGLVGTRVEDHPVGEPSELTVSLDRAEMLQAIVPRSFAPQFLAGRVSSAGRPPQLVVAVEGTIAGVAGGYRPEEGDAWSFVAMLGVPLREGPNDVELFEVVRAGPAVELRPLS